MDINKKKIPEIFYKNNSDPFTTICTIYLSHEAKILLLTFRIIILRIMFDIVYNPICRHFISFSIRFPFDYVYVIQLYWKIWHKQIQKRKTKRSIWRYLWFRSKENKTIQKNFCLSKSLKANKQTLCTTTCVKI